VQYGCSFFHEMQCLAARGYVVVYANPRGSSGYGLKFMSSIHADWGNLDYKDVMRVADWIGARPYVDKRRIGVTGGSYGGYMTNWLVGHTDRFRAAVTQRSVVNLESMYGTCDYGYTLGRELGGTPWKNVAMLRRQSPLTFVKNIKTPLLIIHSEQDLRCSIEQAEQLFACLRFLGREVEFVRFEGESHGLSRDGRPQNRAERLRRIIAWFDKHLAP
jgi:dipeptidyl aminopeptidase/acylaminoacyl peptidase